MIIIQLTMPPKTLVGILSRYLISFPNNMFVGTLDKRVRELLIEEIKQGIGRGRAIILWSTNTPTGYQIEAFGHHDPIIEIDGMQFIAQGSADKRAANREPQKFTKTSGTGWSNASKYQAAKRHNKR